MMLFWLRPSRQIRPPIYSLKQTKLRKRRVIRYAILYFVLMVVFIALIVGPIVVGRQLSLEIDLPMELLQPIGLNNNDTHTTVSGSCLNGMKCPGPAAGAKATANSDKLRRFMAF